MQAEQRRLARAGHRDRVGVVRRGEGEVADPVRLSIAPVPPESDDSAVWSCARVETWLVPVPNVIVVAALEPNWTTRVWPCETAF